MNIPVIVMAGPNNSRPDAHARLRRSIEESDAAKGWQWLEHLDGVSKEWHWRAVHEAAANVGSELVVILEDDVIVNKHLIHNISTWKWTAHKDFGAGFLWNPGGYTGRDTWYSGMLEWYGTVGVVYRTQDLPRLVESAWPRIQKEKLAWDAAITWAVARNGRRIRVHYPAIVEHLDDVPSLVGNRAHPHRTSRGTYSADFRRPNGHEHGNLDMHGRPRA